MEGIFFEGGGNGEAIARLADTLASFLFTSGGTHTIADSFVLKLKEVNPGDPAWSQPVSYAQFRDGIRTRLEECRVSDERLKTLVEAEFPKPEPAPEPVVQAEPVTANDASDAGDSSVDLNKKPTSRQVRRTIEAYLEMLPENERANVLMSAGTFLGILQTKIET